MPQGPSPADPVDRPGLRTLRVIARLNIGGPARHAAILDAGLRRRGFETLVVYGTSAAEEGSLEGLVVGRALPALPLPELGRRISPWSDARALIRLVRLVFRERPDIVHTHTAKAGTLGRLAALAYNVTRRRRQRCLVVHTFHGHVLTGYFGWSGNLAVRSVERMLAKITDRIVTISVSQQTDIADRFAIASPRKTVVVPLGLELEPFLKLSGPEPDAKRRWSFDADAVVFAYVGRFVPIKGLDALLEAFASAARSSPRLRLLMVGDGELRPFLEAQAKSLGVDTAVRFTGWQSDLPSIYAAADAVVLNSLNEGTPVAAIEAMAAGLPVIATSVGGVPDLVQDGRNGLLVPPRQADRMARAMLALAGDPTLRKRLGTTARLDVRERYAAERLVSEIAELYRNALRVKRRTADW